VNGWGTGSIRVRAADGHLTEIRTTTPPDDAEFVLCPDRIDRLARELLDVASTAHDPLPLVEAARVLLSMIDGRTSRTPTDSSASASTSNGRSSCSTP